MATSTSSTGRRRIGRRPVAANSRAGRHRRCFARRKGWRPWDTSPEASRTTSPRTRERDRARRARRTGAAKRAAALTHRRRALSWQTLDPKPVDVELEVVGASGLWPALVDANRLESALLNLCINARDAMPDGCRSTIETANEGLDERAAREREVPPGQYLSPNVSDTGSGMSVDTAARAFDPFFTTKPLGAGTGLGLSFVASARPALRSIASQAWPTRIRLAASIPFDAARMPHEIPHERAGQCGRRASVHRDR